MANIFFYTKNGVTIMIDAGYNYGRLAEKMEWLGLDPAAIRHILITHQDTGHVGAVEVDSHGLFRGAKLYIGEEENRYLTGEVRRKVIFGLYKLPMVKIDNKRVLLRGGQVLDIEGIKVECFLVPGHTWGHMVYLIDDAYLFTGDPLWFGPDGGKSFINMLAEDNKLALRSLAELEAKLRGRSLRPKIITGHTGWTDSLDFTFAHRDKVCNAWVRQKPHDPDAPYGGYDESDDTEEQVRKYPDLFPDRDAERVVRELGEDISGKALYRLQYMWMNCLIRQYNLAWEITEYLKVHPKATVVELGAGLSCLRRQMGNETNPWYCLDMADVIALRDAYPQRGARKERHLRPQ